MKNIILLFILVFSSLAWSSTTKVFRIYHDLKQDIKFQHFSTDKTITLPSGSRILATEIENQFYAYDPVRKKYERVKLTNKRNLNIKTWPPLKEDFYSGMKTCKTLSNIKEVFVNEAREALHFSTKIKKRDYRRYYKAFKDTHPKMAKEYINSTKAFNENFPDFSKLVIKLDKSLSKITSDTMLLGKLNRYLDFLNKKRNSHQLINTYRDILLRAFNPKAAHRADALSFGDTTFYSLFNYDFIITNYNKWYKNNWRYSTINPMKGNSGEGFNSESLDDQESDWYKLKEQLFKFKRITEPEHKSYVSNITDNKFENNERIIFIHNKTFFDRFEGAWRDYIPVEQSTSCFVSDALLSTLIHESNVNAGRYTYFPDDTHAYPVEITYGNFLKYRNENFHKFKSIIAREPHLHTIYLDFILNQLD
jgi:hypothetical protein